MSFLFVDRIVDLSPGQFIKGIKHITNDDLYLTTDYEGRYCFIPSLIGETLGQLAAWNVMQCNQFSHRPVAGVVSSAQLHRPAYLGETLFLESYIDSLDAQAVAYHSVATIGDEVVFTIEGALGPLLPMDDFISQDEIQRQFAEINRPGDWSLLKEAHQVQAKRSLYVSGLSTVPPMVFDRILESEPGVSLVAEKSVSRAAAFFPDHFPRKPVLPLTVLLECKLNLARQFIAEAGFNKAYQLREFRKIKMSEFVQPGDTLVCYVKVKEHSENTLVLSYRSEVQGKRVCVADVVFIAKGH